MEPNILSYVRANPGNTVRSYAAQLNLPQRTVHDALNTPDGRMLADLGLLATEEGVQLPPWARLEDGSRNPNVKLVPKPERALIVIPQPQKSGAKTFDDVNLEAHGVDNILVNGTMRQKRDALRDKENVEGMRAMVVARMNDQLDARDDNLDGLRIALRAKDVALAAKDDALTSKDKTLTIIEAENARLHKEIAVLRAA